MKVAFSKVTATLTVVVAMIITAALAWQARSFEIDASADTLLMKDNRHYLISQQVAEKFDPSEFILIAFEPRNQGIFDPKTLSNVLELGNRIGKLDRVTQVNSIANVPLFTALDNFSADLDVDALTWEKRRFSASDLEKKLTNHPLYEGLLVNKAHTALGLQVVFATPPPLQKIQSELVAIQSQLLTGELTDDEDARLTQLMAQRSIWNKKLDAQRMIEIDEVRQLVSEYASQGEFYLGGNNLLAYQLIKIIKSDLVVFGGLIVLIVSAVIYAIFRQIRWVLLSLVCSAMSVVCTLGLLSVFGLKVTVISANVVALQIILTLAIIIHLIVQYQELIPSISDRRQRISETVRLKVKPCLYAGLTTAIGFGSLIFSGVQPVISFGWMMVVAMFVTIVISLSVFPAMLLVFFSESSAVSEPQSIQKGVKWAARCVQAYPRWIVAISILLVIAGVIGAARLTAENSFLNYFKASIDVHRELTFIDQKFGGSTPIDIIYRIPDRMKKTDVVLGAEAEQTLRQIHNILSKKAAVGAITSVADFTRIAHVVAGKPLTEYELTAFYQGLDAKTKDDFFNAYFNERAGELRISARIQDSTKNLQRAELMEDIHSEIHALGVPPDHYLITGLFVLYQDILERLVKSQFYTLGIVYGAMLLVLWAVFRSLRIALIALVPNLITTACIFGIMGIAGIALDLMTLTIAAVAMGISVDDTIHYIHRYLQEVNQDQALKQGAENPVAATHLSVGYALIYTSLIIVCGFASLMFSDFIPSVLFGVLTSVTMIVALFTDVTILPVMLKRFVTPKKSTP